MADDAEARREARRRKILENAQSRLEKITGRKEEPQPDFTINNHDFNAGKDDTFHYTSIPEMNGSIPSLSIDEFSPVIRGRASYKQNTPLLTSTALEDDLIHENLHINSLIATNESVDLNLSESYLTSKFVIIVLAILMRLLYTLQLSQLYANTIFLPLILLEMFYVTLNRSGKESLGVLGATLLLCGFPPTITNSLAKYLSILKNLLLDFCLYFFTFVLSHVILSNVETILKLNV